MVLQLTSEKVKWLQQNGYTIESHLAHGKNSCVWKVKLRNTFYVLKTSHPKSDRWLPLSEEATHLQDVNQRGIGPTLVWYNLIPEMLFLDFIEGKDFGEWLGLTKKAELETVLRHIFKQTNVLNERGLKHFELGKNPNNIRVDTNNYPHLLDFDKTKYVQNPENTKEIIQQWLFGKSKIAKTIQKMLGVDGINRLVNEFQ